MSDKHLDWVFGDRLVYLDIFKQESLDLIHCLILGLSALAAVCKPLSDSCSDGSCKAFQKRDYSVLWMCRLRASHLWRALQVLLRHLVWSWGQNPLSALRLEGCTAWILVWREVVFGLGSLLVLFHIPLSFVGFGTSQRVILGGRSLNIICMGNGGCGVHGPSCRKRHLVELSLPIRVMRC